jgi:hypothetical protein
MHAASCSPLAKEISMKHQSLTTPPAAAAIAPMAIKKIATLRRTIGAAATLAIALVGMSAAFADDSPTVDCTIRFKLSGWSAIYERADGAGTVSCQDGTSMPVVIRVRGVGISAGRSKVDNGTGKFAYVHAISDVLGSYAQGDVHAGVGKSGTAQLLTNGKISLALAGAGEGFDLGIGVADFTIRQAK